MRQVVSSKEVHLWFSRYVRLLYANNTGELTCYTCGKTMHIKDAQCGHLFSRTHKNTLYDLENVRPQCRGCNVMRNGNYSAFFPNILREIGLKKLFALEVKAKTPRQFTTKQREELYTWYRKEVLVLLSKKGIPHWW